MKRNHVILLFSLMLMVVFLAGCHRYVNVEEETPPGYVPPPAAPPRPQLPPELRGQKLTPQLPPPQMKMQTVKRVGDSQGNQISKSAAINDFEQAYRKQGDPRITIFLNRELSDEVREWRMNSRTNISSSGSWSETEGDSYSTNEKSNTSATAGGETESSKTGEWSKTEGTTTRSGEGRSQTTIGREIRAPLHNARAYPGEKWMWAMEDGFTQVFMDAGTNLVDRAMVMRLTASDRGDEHRHADIVNTKLVEIDALKGYTDIFIELIIIRDTTSPLGYSFRAKAKDVNNGYLLASANIMTWDDIRIQHKRLVSTNQQGYQIDVDEFPSVMMISEQLALDIMSRLARRWNR